MDPLPLPYKVVRCQISDGKALVAGKSLARGGLLTGNLRFSINIEAEIHWILAGRHHGVVALVSLELRTGCRQDGRVETAEQVGHHGGIPGSADLDFNLSEIVRSLGTIGIETGIPDSVGLADLELDKREHVLELRFGSCISEVCHGGHRLRIDVAAGGYRLGLGKNHMQSLTAAASCLLKRIHGDK